MRSELLWGIKETAKSLQASGMVRLVERVRGVFVVWVGCLVYGRGNGGGGRDFGWILFVRQRVGSPHVRGWWSGD